MSRAAVSPETAAEPAPRKTRSKRKTPPRAPVGGGSGAREVPVSKTTIIAHLEASSGPQEEADIARALGADRDQLRKVLLDLSGEGVAYLGRDGWALGDQLEYDRQREDAAIDKRVLNVVSQSSELLTTADVAARVGISNVVAGASLERLQAQKKVTPLRDKWSAGAPENERKAKRSRPTFAPRRTPREQVEEKIKDRRLTWSQLRAELPNLEPHMLRHGLDLIGRDGFLSFTKAGYQLRKKKGKPTTPIGVARPDLQAQLGFLLDTGAA